MAPERIAVVKQVHAAIAGENMRVALHVRIPLTRGSFESQAVIIANPVVQVVGIGVADSVTAALVRPEVGRFTVAEEHMVTAVYGNHRGKRLAFRLAQPIADDPP